MQKFTSQAILNELSKRVKNYRLDMELSQAEFARKAGLSLRSVVNFESGSDLMFSNFIKILRALDLADNLNLLVPDVTKRPSSFLETKKPKQRVRKTSKKDNSSSFKWGDEE